MNILDEILGGYVEIFANDIKIDTTVYKAYVLVLEVLHPLKGKSWLNM